MANRTREEPRSVGRPRRNPKRVGLCCKSIDFRGAFIRGARHLLEMRADMASVSTEEKVALEEKYGLAPGILGRDAPAGKDKAPSIKEMKATIRKAGLGVADLVEKSDVVKRYQEALARLGKS